MNNKRCAVVIVTYNRKKLVLQCLDALAQQTLKPDLIIIIDNASTDGTQEALAEHGWLSLKNVVALKMQENLGGSAGFTAGLKYATANQYDWIWLMDDDALPVPTALEELLNIANNPQNIYGSLAIDNNDTAWTVTLIEQGNRNVHSVDEVPDCAQVMFVPFLGFMIHKELVARIGFPDTDFFIAADDVEYCFRAKKNGAQIIIAGKSRIHHPKAQRYFFNLPGKTLICLQLPPWKRYYDTRNRLIIAKKYYGWRIITQTFPGSFIRLFATLCHEPRKIAQSWAFLTGFIDGILGIKGKRHSFWKIP